MEKEIYWSRFAENFEELNSYVAGEESIQATRDALKSCALSGSVLELGCGNGTYSKILAETAETVYATDYSDEMLAVSKKRLSAYDNIKLSKENCLELSYAAESFDAVVIINLLHVIADPHKALTESRRVLRPGGRVVVISFTRESSSEEELKKMIERYLSTYGNPPKTGRSLTIDSTHSLLAESDLKVESISLIGNTTKAVFAQAYHL